MRTITRAWLFSWLIAVAAAGCAVTNPASYEDQFSNVQPPPAPVKEADPKSELQPTAPPPIDPAILRDVGPARMWATDRANVRTGPTMDASVVKTLTVGQAVIVDGIVNGWYRLDDGTFVSAAHLSALSLEKLMARDHVTRQTVEAEAARLGVSIVWEELPDRTSGRWSASQAGMIKIDPKTVDKSRAIDVVRHEAAHEAIFLACGYQGIPPIAGDRIEHVANAWASAYHGGVAWYGDYGPPTLADYEIATAIKDGRCF